MVVTAFKEIILVEIRNFVAATKLQCSSTFITGRTVDALKIILKTAPIGSKCQSVKDAANALAMRVLLAVKASEMEQAVRALDPEAVDVLMKYIYRGFESPSEGSSGHLLAWHEKAYAAGGIGSIVRVMTDRKRV